MFFLWLHLRQICFHSWKYGPSVSRSVTLGVFSWVSGAYVFLLTVQVSWSSSISRLTACRYTSVSATQTCSESSRGLPTLRHTVDRRKSFFKGTKSTWVDRCGISLKEIKCIEDLERDSGTKMWLKMATWVKWECGNLFVDEEEDSFGLGQSHGRTYFRMWRWHLWNGSQGGSDKCVELSGRTFEPQK